MDVTVREKDAFDKVKDIAHILSLILIPITIASGGWLIQKSITEQEIRRDYLRIAVDILSSESNNKELKQWAVNIFNKEAPEKVSSRAFTHLSLAKFPLPPVLSELCPPINKIQGNSWDDLALAYAELIHDYSACAAKHEAMVGLWNAE